MRKKLTYKSVLATVIIAAGFLFSSCFKEDEPYVLPAPGDAEYFTVAQGEDYHRQVCFSLESLDTLGSEHNIWDLAFESSDSGWHIWINGSAEALIANMQTQEFTDVADTAGADWKWDAPSWNEDSTAIGDWPDDRLVYILDRGPDRLPGDRYKKIIFQEVNNQYFEIQYANLDGSSEQLTDIYKSSVHVFIYFTFDNGGQTLNIEPPQNDWDLLFTRYRTIFYDQFSPLPYLVTGVLINPSVQVAVDSVVSFSSINYENAQSMMYSSSRDIIGYRWKQFDFGSQAYVCKPYINYVIRDVAGVYWKLHFLDFYNEQGEKGYPFFEFQRL